MSLQGVFETLIFRLPFQLWSGITLLILIVFQIAVARKFLHIPFKWHRIVGYIILILAIIHAAIGIGLHYGLFLF